VKRILTYGIVSLFLAIVFFFGLRAYGEAVAYERATAKLAEKTTPELLAEFQAKEWMEKLSLGLYKNKQKKKLKVLQKKIHEHRIKSMKWTWYSMACMGLVLLSYFILSLRAFTFFSALGAGIMLLFGLYAPVLMVTIHKQITYLGDAVLSFESKGVLGSVEKLFANGESVVAGVILLFSIIVPVIKILSMTFVAVFMKSRFSHGIVVFFKHLGKWSMVDVFVVATFLVYLTTNKGDVSRAEIGVGLYFFLAYVLVSMLVSLSAEKMLKQVEM